MKVRNDIPPILRATHSPIECERRLGEARRLFHRTLSSWASDLLILRSRGLRTPQWVEAQRKAA